MGSGESRWSSKKNTNLIAIIVSSWRRGIEGCALAGAPVRRRLLELWGAAATSRGTLDDACGRGFGREGCDRGGCREHVKGEGPLAKGKLTHELWRGHRSAPRPRVSLVTLAEVMAIVSLVSATTWLITGMSLSSFVLGTTLESIRLREKTLSG